MPWQVPFAFIAVSSLGVVAVFLLLDSPWRYVGLAVLALAVNLVLRAALKRFDRKNGAASRTPESRETARKERERLR